MRYYLSKPEGNDRMKRKGKMGAGREVEDEVFLMTQFIFDVSLNGL